MFGGATPQAYALPLEGTLETAEQVGREGEQEKR